VLHSAHLTTRDQRQKSLIMNSSLRYGLGLTLLLSLLVLIAFILLQTFSLGVYAGAALSVDGQALSQEQMQAIMGDLAFDGTALSIITIVSGVLSTLLIFLLIKFKSGVTIVDYLGLYRVSFATVFKWLLIMVAILLLSEAVLYFSNEESIPEFMRAVHESSPNKLLLFFAIAIIAPLFEEIFFRGFLFEGLKYSAAGFLGASVISSLVWALIHLQYSAIYIVMIFVFGLVFSYAKHKTSSLYVPIILHIFVNTLALVQTDLALS